MKTQTRSTVHYTSLDNCLCKLMWKTIESADRMTSCDVRTRRELMRYRAIIQHLLLR